MTGSPISARARTRISIGVLLLAVAIPIALDGYGKSRRIVSDRTGVLEVERPEETYGVWKESGASGRTLLLFGAFPHPWRRTGVGPHQRGPESFVTLAALDNVVRRIYVVIPDDSWDALFGAPMPGFFRRVPGLERGFYMQYALGLPVIATTPSSLPSVSERPLIYVDRGRFELSNVERILADKGIAFDLIVASTGM